MICRTSVKSKLLTVCPNGGRDVNCVTISWESRKHIAAEVIHEMIAAYAGRTAYCESLAEAIAVKARQLVGPVTVQVEQIYGHGVSVEVSIP